MSRQPPAVSDQDSQSSPTKAHPPKQRVHHTLPARLEEKSDEDCDDYYCSRGKRSPAQAQDLEPPRSSSGSSRSPSLRPVNRHKSADTDHDVPFWIQTETHVQSQKAGEPSSNADWAVRFRNMHKEAVELSPQTDADREQHKREHMARLEELQKFSRTFQLTTPTPEDIADIFHPRCSSSSSKTITDGGLQPPVELTYHEEETASHQHPVIEPPSPEINLEASLSSSGFGGIEQSMIFGGTGLAGSGRLPDQREQSKRLGITPGEASFISSPAYSEPLLSSSDEEDEDDYLYESFHEWGYKDDQASIESPGGESIHPTRNIPIRRSRKSSEDLLMARSVPGSATGSYLPLAPSPALSPAQLLDQLRTYSEKLQSQTQPQTQYQNQLYSAPPHSLAAASSPTDHATLVALWSKLVKMSESIPATGGESSSSSGTAAAGGSATEFCGTTTTSKSRVDKNAFPTLDWTDFLTQDNDEFIGGGNFGDVYRGKWIGVARILEESLERQEREMETSSGGAGSGAGSGEVNVGMGLSLRALPKIVIKVMRTPQVTQKKAEKRFKQLKREIRVWHNLNHPNIVPFVGLTHARGGKLPSLVSLWMENGSSKEYIKTPGVCRLSFINGIAKGLQYLHAFKPQIIHGDLKGDNVLADGNGNPRLGDFGLSRMMEKDLSLWQTSATQAPGTTRWKAVELMTGDQATVSVPGDIWAYAMTSLELMTDATPFSHIRNETAMIAAVVLYQKRPLWETAQAAGVERRLWELWERCWANSADDRPSMKRVLQDMKRIVNGCKCGRRH